MERSSRQLQYLPGLENNIFCEGRGNILNSSAELIDNRPVFCDDSSVDRTLGLLSPQVEQVIISRLRRGRRHGQDIKLLCATYSF